MNSVLNLRSEYNRVARFLKQWEKTMVAKKYRGRVSSDMPEGVLDTLEKEAVKVDAINEILTTGPEGEPGQPTNSRKPKAPRDVQYWLTGINIEGVRVILAEFATLRQLNKYAKPLRPAFVGAYRNLRVARVKLIQTSDW